MSVNKPSFEIFPVLYLHLQDGYVVLYSMPQNHQVILDSIVIMVTNPVTNPVTKPITKPVIVPEYTATKKRHIPIKKILMFAVTSAIVIAAYASIDTLELFDTNTVPVFEFSINTDAENYNIGDIISVYGNAKESVKISVLDESYNIIWFEEISPDSMNSYSILVIADGDGWSVGKYTIMASYGAESDSVMITVQ